jgi:hypothetical protein
MDTKSESILWWSNAAREEVEDLVQEIEKTGLAIRFIDACRSEPALYHCNRYIFGLHNIRTFLFT